MIWYNSTFLKCFYFYFRLHVLLMTFFNWETVLLQKLWNPILQRLQTEKKKGTTTNPKILEHTKLWEWDNPVLTQKMCEMIDYNSKIFTFLERKCLPEICGKHSLLFIKKNVTIQTIFLSEMLSHTHRMSSKFPCTVLEYVNNSIEAWLQMHKTETD